MENSKILSREDVKAVTGGELEPQHMSAKCPKCGEWNDNGWYYPPGIGEPCEELKVTFHCKNCNTEYTWGFLVKK